MFIDKTQLKTKRKPGYLLRHNSQLAIGNNLYWFLVLVCELWLSTGTIYPKRFGMSNVLTLCTHMCEATFWNIKWSETSQRSACASGVKCIRVRADSTHQVRVINVVGTDVEARFSCTCHKHVISTGRLVGFLSKEWWWFLEEIEYVFDVWSRSSYLQIHS